MKLGILTSSRAEFGIYLPLLKKIEDSGVFNLEIIAFGTHLSKFHGFTVNEIRAAGFSKIYEISSLLTNDDELAISTAFGLTALKFADFWGAHQFDWVLCLGDRFEMAAAVQAGIPFGVKFAHIHGGETTLGAIDNIYRHQITLASIKHFPATLGFAKRIREIVGSPDNIYPVGSLSIDELENISIPGEKEFREKYKINGEFILVTFHPETKSPERNRVYASEMRKALLGISLKATVVITMPNADTFGTIYRGELFALKSENEEKIILIENFGKTNYFAAMQYCKMLIGNTSSGIIEAASFKKYVINVGDRQKGRLQSENTTDVPFDSEKIIESFSIISNLGDYTGENIYHMPGTADKIIKHLKE